MLYSLNYDLKGPKADYGQLIEAIKGIGTWWHYLDSMWLVVSCQSAQQVYDRISQYLKPGDNLIIMDVTGSSYWGILPRNAWAWISEHQHEEQTKVKSQ